MRYTILLDRSENTKEAEAQEQARFIKSMLESMEVPIEWNPNDIFTVESKAKFRKALEAFNINIIYDADGGIKIFVDSDIVGEWKKCKYKLKEDRSQINPKKRLFLEMNVEFSSIYEENNETR